ncbi:MAG: hypothetical protein QXW04_00055 [Candidatus Aenigmatarchaeota archaeon]
MLKILKMKRLIKVRIERKNRIRGTKINKIENISNSLLINFIFINIYYGFRNKNKEEGWKN